MLARWLVDESTVEGLPVMPRMVSSADVFHVIADPTRRALIDLLREGEKQAGVLASSFIMTQAAVSQHLGVLRRAGLVREIRIGRYRFYHLEAEKLRLVAEWIAHYEQFWPESPEKID